jgi:hypothetical protein
MVGRGIEEAHVVGDRSGEELVVLHHRAHELAVAVDAQLLDVDAAREDLAVGGRSSPSISLSSVVFPPPDAPTIATTRRAPRRTSS